MLFDHLNGTCIRRVARETAFAWALSLDASWVKLESVPENGHPITVADSARGRSWRLQVDTDQKAVRIGMSKIEPQNI